MTDSNVDPIEKLKQDVEARLNTETAKISWPELERHFARGVVVRVAKNLDLIKVAAAMVDDDKERVDAWLKAGLVARASDKDAKVWSKTQPTFWAVVVAPWVMVQVATEDWSES